MVGTIASPHQEPLKGDSKIVTGGVNSSFTGHALSTQKQYSTLGLCTILEDYDPIRLDSQIWHIMGTVVR